MSGFTPFDSAEAGDNSNTPVLESKIHFDAVDTSADDDKGVDDICTMNPDILPVAQFRKQLVSLIRENQVVIVAGETGSGKTTQLPQFLAEEKLVSSDKRLAVTQPRRLAAMAVAERVAHEMDCKLGEKVGYSVRFDDQTSSETVVRFLTDGLLLREFILNPRLDGYNIVMIDEAHERTLQTDIVLALVRDVARQRPDFKVIVSSATLNSSKFAAYFGNAPVFEVPGRRFPVQMLYTCHAEPDYTQATISTIFQIHISQPLGGDILVFLPGQEEIENVEERLLRLSVDLGAAVPELLVVPVFANMTSDQQSRIFKPTPAQCRKVILATNIAETSLTIPGITYVIDPGLVKMQEYNSRSGLDSLSLRRCSKASANQRAGRAGRTAPGKCFRLYTKTTFEQDMPNETPPEVLRTNLASVCLLLLTLGVPDVAKFGFLDKPANESVAWALTELYALGAVNAACELTRRGRILAEFPTNPQMARALLSSVEYGCIDAISTVVAMLNELSALYVRPKGRKTEANAAHAQLAVSKGDHYTLINIYDEWKNAKYSAQWCHEYYIQLKALRRAREVKNQLQQMCTRVAKRTGLKQQGEYQFGLEMSLVSGFFTRCARLSKTKQHFVVFGKTQPVYIHPGSVLWASDPLPKVVMYHELVLTSREYMRGCMEVDPSIMKMVVPHFYYQTLERKEMARQ